MKSLEIDSRDLARRMRVQALQMVHRAKASHIGSALSICDIVAVLYGQVMNLEPVRPEDMARDRFILSKGHACVAVYAALAETGFFPIEDLLNYGQDHSVLMNHISHKVAGVEFSTGSLGHGLPFGTGKALAARLSKQDWRTFVVLSDGELGEGSNWEAIMFASHHKLNNLTFIIDNNNLQSLTTIKDTLNIYPLESKFRSFGLDYESVNGHDYRSLKRVLKKKHPKKPRVIIAKTIKGKGIKKMENKVIWHYKPPSKTEFNDFLAELNNL